MKQICSTKDSIIIEQFISMFIKFSKTTVLMLQFINYEMNLIQSLFNSVDSIQLN